MLPMVSALVPAACTAPGNSEPAKAISSAPVAVAEQLDEGAESGRPEEAVVTSRRGRSPIDSEELIGLGELGLLPALFQTLGTGIDCDFDDALSTCQ